MKYQTPNLLYCIIMLTTLLQQTEFISFSFPDDMGASISTQNKDNVLYLDLTMINASILISILHKLKLPSKIKIKIEYVRYKCDIFKQSVLLMSFYAFLPCPVSPGISSIRFFSFFILHMSLCLDFVFFHHLFLPFLGLLSSFSDFNYTYLHISIHLL